MKKSELKNYPGIGLSELKNYPGTGLASCPVYDSDYLRFSKCIRCTFCIHHWEQCDQFSSAITSHTFHIPHEMSMCFSCHSKMLFI